MICSSGTLPNGELSLLCTNDHFKANRYEKEQIYRFIHGVNNNAPDLLGWNQGHFFAR